MKKRAAIYVRVSTGAQTVRNQLKDLNAVAKKENWEVVDVFEDTSSGGNGRDKRPGYDALMRGIAQRKYSVVACWSVCRVSRTMTDLVSFLAELNGTGTHFFCYQQGIDTQTVGGRFLFQLIGLIGEWERGMLRDRIMAGLARARAEGRRGGRPKVAKEKADKVLAALRAGAGIREAARAGSVGLSVVQRLKRSLRGPKIKSGKAWAAQG